MGESVGVAWDVSLCGPLAVRTAHERIEDRLPGRQGRLLFAYLLEHRARTCTRGELAELLWPDRPASASDGALSALLSKLRRALGDGVISGRGGLRLQPPPGTRIDTDEAAAAVAAAETALEAGDAPRADALARRALAVDLLAYLPGIDGGWAQERRRELEALRLRALEVAAAAGLARGKPHLGAAEQAARAAVAAAPFRETAYRLLMEVLAADGRHAEAAQAYEELRVRLADELGIEPGHAVQELHERLQGEGSAPPERCTAPADPAAAELPVALSLALERHGFVGRGTDMDALRANWEEVAAGGRRIAFLTGDAGIGKTRLAAELAREAHGAGALVLFGRCDEETLGPYQPFVEILRGVGGNLPDLFGRLGARGSELARLMPELAPSIPDAEGTGVRDAAAQRFRLFSAVVALLSVLGERRPIVLVLDDLHWADRPTLQLLRHIARATVPERILILGTYRDGELRHEDPLPALAGDLAAEGAATRIPLEGLEAPDVAVLVAELLPMSPDEGFVHAVRSETEGNPFFIEEVLRHIGETASPADAAQMLRRTGVPEGVRETVGRRLRRLHEDTVTTIAVAAVIGREFDFDLLAEVGPARGDALLGALEDALEARVVREVPERPGRYAFTHALIRQAVHDDLSALRRARIHGRVGEALVRLRARRIETHLGQIAYHFAEAAAVEAPDRAVHWAMRAARRAEELVAHEEAAEHYRRALRALELMGPDGDEHRRGELLVHLGSALQRSGDESARAAFATAAAVARRTGDPELLAHAALGYAGAWNHLGRVRQDRVDLLEEALSAIGTADSSLRALLLARLTLELYYAGTPQQRLALSGEALAIARRLEDPALLAGCLDARHYALWRPENAEERLAVAHEACAVAEAAGDRERLLESLGWTVVDYLELGDVASVDRQIERASALAEAAHLPLYLWWTSLFRSMRAQLEGDFEDGERLALETLALGQRGSAENAMTCFGMQLYNIRREQARLDEVLEPVRSFVTEYPAVPAWRALLAHAYVELGRTREAGQEIERVAGAPGGVRALPWDANWLICVTLLAEACAALGDRDRCTDLYEVLEPYATRNVVVGRAATCNGAAARLLGVLAAAQRRWDVAERHFDLAAAMHRRMGAVPWLVRTQVAWAELLLARGAPGDRQRAAALLDEAAQPAAAIGMVAVGRRIAALTGKPAPAPGPSAKTASAA